MKINKAPEKIYVHVKVGKILNTWNSEWIGVHDIEYTRTDAFIEKACDWLEQTLSPYIPYCNIDIDLAIEDFKKYMEGE